MVNKEEVIQRIESIFKQNARECKFRAKKHKGKLLISVQPTYSVHSRMLVELAEIHSFLICPSVDSGYYLEFTFIL